MNVFNVHLLGTGRGETYTLESSGAGTRVRSHEYRFVGHCGGLYCVWLEDIGNVWVGVVLDGQQRKTMRERSRCEGGLVLMLQSEVLMLPIYRSVPLKYEAPRRSLTGNRFQ